MQDTNYKHEQEKTDEDEDQIDDRRRWKHMDSTWSLMSLKHDQSIKPQNQL